MSEERGTRHTVKRVLGIETSCDETAAAVVEDGTSIVSSVVSSQIDLHARYGGVVPELASRAHVELLTPVLADALEQAGSDHTGRVSSARCWSV
jgi:N6-L-threonylcarbamoyladenine synthase